MAGVKTWNYYQQQQIEQAAELYSSLLQIEAGGDTRKISDAAQLVMTGFPGQRLRIACRIDFGARQSFEGGDVQNAKSRLQWTLDNTKEDELKDLVRLRLAGLLLDEQKYDDALKAAG